MIVPKNGSRDALLTIQDKIHLSSKHPKQKSIKKIEKQLDKRLEALFYDLNLIISSKHLAAWRARYVGNLLEVLDLIRDLTLSYKTVYLYPVRRYKKKFGKRLLFVYWLDISERSPISAEKIFEPSFALRKIKSRITKEIERILTKAIKKEKIPTEKEKALPVEKLERLILK